MSQTILISPTRAQGKVHAAQTAPARNTPAELRGFAGAAAVAIAEVYAGVRATRQLAGTVDVPELTTLRLRALLRQAVPERVHGLHSLHIRTTAANTWEVVALVNVNNQIRALGMQVQAEGTGLLVTKIAVGG